MLTCQIRMVNMSVPHRVVSQPSMKSYKLFINRLNYMFKLDSFVIMSCLINLNFFFPLIINITIKILLLLFKFMLIIKN